MRQAYGQRVLYRVGIGVNCRVIFVPPCGIGQSAGFGLA